MDIISLSFFLLWVVGIVLYYSICKSHQWKLLLAVSVFFYAISLRSVPVVLFFVATVTFGVARYIHESRKKPLEVDDRVLRHLRNIAVVTCVIMLLIGRNTSWFATLGNSYFTLKAIGYLVDSERYNSDEYYENNFLFYLLYLVYFPTIAQ